MLKVLKFTAVWCGPCKRLAPIYTKIKSEIKDADFEEVDVDENPALATQFKIMSIPTLVFIKDGLEVNRLVGLVSEKDIKDTIEVLK
ncbi:MAG: thioredoxin family protein [Patescibacteria group bacterium]